MSNTIESEQKAIQFLELAILNLQCCYKETSSTRYRIRENDLTGLDIVTILKARNLENRDHSSPPEVADPAAWHPIALTIDFFGNLPDGPQPSWQNTFRASLLKEGSISSAYEKMKNDPKIREIVEAANKARAADAAEEKREVVRSFTLGFDRDPLEAQDFFFIRQHEIANPTANENEENKDTLQGKDFTLVGQPSLASQAASVAAKFPYKTYKDAATPNPYPKPEQLQIQSTASSDLAADTSHQVLQQSKLLEAEVPLTENPPTQEDPPVVIEEEPQTVIKEEKIELGEGVTLEWGAVKIEKVEHQEENIKPEEKKIEEQLEVVSEEFSSPPPAPPAPNLTEPPPAPPAPSFQKKIVPNEDENNEIKLSSSSSTPEELYPYYLPSHNDNSKETPPAQETPQKRWLPQPFAAMYDGGAYLFSYLQWPFDGLRYCLNSAWQLFKAGCVYVIRVIS